MERLSSQLGASSLPEGLASFFNSSVKLSPAISPESDGDYAVGLRSKNPEPARAARGIGIVLLRSRHFSLCPVRFHSTADGTSFCDTHWSPQSPTAEVRILCAQRLERSLHRPDFLVDNILLLFKSLEHLR